MRPFRLPASALGNGPEVKVGLVLGAGGAVGAAYLAGALTALEHDLGFDARDAAVIAGTSAGSLVGALLRAGVPASDLAAWTVDAPLSPAGRRVTLGVERPVFDPVRLRSFLRPPRLPHPSAVLAALRSPLRFDPLRALMTHVADGRRRIEPHTEFLGTGWPARPLYVNAVRRRDGRRVVLGRDDVPRAGLGAAVAASCAVPGYFAPVDVDGTTYIDGGVRSATNADVLRHADLDVVIALAPMGAIGPGPRFGLDAEMRNRATRRLHAELAPIAAAGTDVAVFAPGPEVRAAITWDFMDEARCQEIVAAAFVETGEAARATERAPAVRTLRSGPRRRGGTAA